MKLQQYFDSYSRQFGAHVSNYGTRIEGFSPTAINAFVTYIFKYHCFIVVITV